MWNRSCRVTPLTVFCIGFINMGTAQERAERYPSSLVLAYVNIIDVTGGPTKHDMSIVIERDRIKTIAPSRDIQLAPNARIIDGRGKFVIPGLADMHNHLGDGSESEYQRNLPELLRWGVTTVFTPGHSQVDLKIHTKLRTAPSEKTAAWPRFYGVGRSISVKGGHASQYGAFLPKTPDEIPAMIAELKAGRADAIKLIYDDLSHTGRAPLPVMNRDVMAAVIKESHKAGLRAYVHAPQLKYAKDVLRAGADGLVHAICDQLVDQEFISLMKKNHALYITTHSLRRVFADRPAWIDSLEGLDEHHRIPRTVYEEWKTRKWTPTASREQLSYTKNNVRRVFDAGVLVVAGTDSGIPGILMGVSSQMELVVLVEDGLTPVKALRTATLNAAKMLGLEADFGSVTPGKVADLVLLDQDPLKDIRNIRTVHLVVKGGVAYDAQALQGRPAVKLGVP